jgi:hypothetical protein
MSRPVLHQQTLVTVQRTIRNPHERMPLIGPKPLVDALNDNDMTNSSGTVGVEVRVVDGPHAGARAVRSRYNADWLADYDPVMQLPSGAARHEMPEPQRRPFDHDPSEPD